MRKKVSFYIPCYNEVGNVRETAETLTSIMQSLPYDYEFIFTDNCSTDGTKDILRELAEHDKHIKVLMNNRNYGIDGRSARNAMKYLSGDVAVVVPCDLQEPLELLPEFFAYWEQGYKVVCGEKTGSQEGRLKYFCRNLFYNIIIWMSDIPQYKHLSGITLLDREVLDEFLKTDYDFAMRFAFADMGYNIKIIPYEQRARKSGKSSYNLWRALNFSINSLVVTSVKPLRIITIVGALMSSFSFLLSVIYLIMKLAGLRSFAAGSAPILIGVLFLGSVQLFCLGILGEYIGEILKKVTRQPDVLLSEKLNMEEFQEYSQNFEMQTVNSK